MIDKFGYEILLQPALYAVAAIGVFVALFRGAGRKRKRFRLQTGAGRRALVAGLVAAVVLPAVVITPPGHRAAIYTLTKGVSDVERNEGLSLVFPYAQTARMVNVRTQVYKNPTVYAQSSDLQEITVHIAVNHHVDPDLAAEVYQTVGLDYEATVIEPAVLQLVKQEVGLVKAVDFAQNRQLLSQNIQTALTEQLAVYGVVVEFVNIEDAVFDPDFIKAVKDKVIAVEEATKQENLIAAEEAKKQQVILQAEAEEQKKLIEARGAADAISSVAGALGFTTDEYLEWMLIGAWSGDLPTTLIGDAGDFSVLLQPLS